MSQIFRAGAGAVLSADVAVPDHERVMRFYLRVLSTGANPCWREDDLMNNLGIPIIGVGARTPEYEQLPLQWMPHIQVEDVGASVQRALDLGGSAPLHTRAEDGSSQWAVLIDLNGAAFGIIPVVPAGAIPPVDPDAGPVGRIAWLDLTVTDAAATRDFYREVVGWTAQDVEMKDDDQSYADYNMLYEDGTPAAGVCHARGVNAALPPVWMIYLPVGDLDESLRRVDEEGGQVISKMQGKDGRYAYAAIQDPGGACLALVPG